jgi:hypothetical protein
MYYFDDEVKILKLPLRELKERSINNWKSQNNFKIRHGGFHKPNEKTIMRWMYGYLRHHATGYNQGLHMINASKVGDKYCNYDFLRYRIDTKIKMIYLGIFDSILYTKGDKLHNRIISLMLRWS